MSPELRTWNWFWYGRAELPTDTNRVELFISNWLIRVGLIVIMVGLGFLVRYTINQGWFTSGARIVGTAFFGVCLYVLGCYLWNSPLNPLARALIVGAVGVLYYLGFGGVGTHSLLPNIVCLGWCYVVSILLLVSAMRWNSEFIATLGILGACLVPSMFSEVRGNIGELALALAVPLLGILVLRRFRTWMWPAWVVLCMAFYQWSSHGGTIDLILGNYPSLPAIGITLGGMAFSLIVFHLVAQRKLRERCEVATISELLFAFVNGLIFLATIQFVLTTCIREGLTYPISPTNLWKPGYALEAIPLLFTTFYLLMAWGMKPTEENRSFRAMNYLLAFLSFFPCVIVLYLDILGAWEDRFGLVTLLFPWCLFFLWLCQKFTHYRMMWTVCNVTGVLALGAIFRLCICYRWSVSLFWSNSAPIVEFSYHLSVLWWIRALNFGILSVCLILVLILVRRVLSLPTMFTLHLTDALDFPIWHRSALMTEEQAQNITEKRFSEIQSFGCFFGIVAGIYLWLWLTLESSYLMREASVSMRHGTLSVAWAICGGILWIISKSTKVRWLSRIALVLLSLAILRTLSFYIVPATEIYRILIFLLFGVVLLLFGIIRLRN